MTALLGNASFNLFGEPLVVSPRDAVRSFYCSGIDALMIDNLLLKKHNG
ncbi:MAG: carbamoyltransferase C-terminal domain-containing protein [Terriglobales bacterium]